jgi:hypothetical protein
MKVPASRPIFALMAAVALILVHINASKARDIVPPGFADGPGIWANVWNYPQGDVDAYCSKLRTHGIRNFFIQTTRTTMPAVAHPEDLGKLIDACHRHKIRVIGWAYLELTDPVGEADKMIAAARFQSPHGETLDAIAPDLEKNLTEAKVGQFSERLRHTLGPSYPMMACVYSPLNRYQEVAHIPWKLLTQYYDVIGPMSYWNSKYQKHLDPYDYTMATVRTIRQLAGRPDIEIHVIGDAMGSSGEALHQFMKACKRSEATSASIYPNQKPTDEQLAILSRYQDYFQANSRFRLAAFRELLRSGAISSPPGNDPTEPISRADFCRLLAKHCRVPVSSVEVAGAAPIYPDEAITFLAQVVDVHQSNAKQHGKKRPDRWFAPPALADAPQRREVSDKPLNYLDAAQMVLEAGSTLR